MDESLYTNDTKDLMKVGKMLLKNELVSVLSLQTIYCILGGGFITLDHYSHLMGFMFA